MGGTSELHSVGVLSIPHFHECHCSSDAASQIELCYLLRERLFVGKEIAQYLTEAVLNMVFICLIIIVEASLAILNLLRPRIV